MSTVGVHEKGGRRSIANRQSQVAVIQVGTVMFGAGRIDGSKFKVVNTRDKNFTREKVERRRTQLEAPGRV